jgi:hypothetical protein
MDNADIKQTHKALYRPPVSEFAIIEVPALNYFMVDGAGIREKLPPGSSRRSSASRCEHRTARKV